MRAQLLAGTYGPKPMRRQEIPKSGGGVRELGILTVLDRLIQQCILQVLQPQFDPTFSEHSYGFRPGRRAHDAVRAAKRLIRQPLVPLVTLLDQGLTRRTRTGRRQRPTTTTDDDRRRPTTTDDDRRRPRTTTDDNDHDNDHDDKRPLPRTTAATTTTAVKTDHQDRRPITPTPGSTRSRGGIAALRRLVLALSRLASRAIVELVADLARGGVGDPRLRRYRASSLTA